MTPSLILTTSRSESSLFFPSHLPYIIVTFVTCFLLSFQVDSVSHGPYHHGAYARRDKRSAEPGESDPQL